MKTLYLLINVFTVLVPFIFSFHPKIRFYKTWKAFFLATLLVAATFIIWDAFFVRLGVWSFNESYVSGLNFFSLPIEEILFFICIPFSCVFTFFCLNKFYNLAWNPVAETLCCILLSLGLFITGLLFYDRLYTSATFISTAFISLILRFICKINWFGKAITVFAILLLPFLIVNGILTGAITKLPIVIYNDTENLGIRIVTIPFEDVFYGFELFLLNVYLYLQFCKMFGYNCSPER